MRHKNIRVKKMLSRLKANVSIKRVWIPDSIYARVKPAFTSCQIREKNTSPSFIFDTFSVENFWQIFHK